MEGLGVLTPTEILTSQIGAVIGEFLVAHSLLIKLTRSSDQDIVDEASKLLTYHSILDNERVTALKIVENVKTGAYTITDVVQATATMWAMVEYNKKVQKLVSKAGGISSGWDIPWGTVAIIGVIGAGAYIVLGRK